MRTGPRSLNVHRGLAAAAALTFASWGAMAPPATAHPNNGDPGGNNGTVKITPHLDADGTESCVFDIEWYGFDEGADIVSTVVFQMQAPSRDVGLSSTGPSEVFVGGDPASGAGTDTGFDGEATYTLAFDGEPDEQGYHVKVTTHTPVSRGADTKHKVLWVQPCDEEPPGA